MFFSFGREGLAGEPFLTDKRHRPDYTKEDAVIFHEQLQAIAVRLAWMLEPGDAIQFVFGEDTTPKQFYKQLLTKDGEEIEVSERQTIHAA
jgi:hypothetical protein